MGQSPTGRKRLSDSHLLSLGAAALKIEFTWYDERLRPDLDAKQITILKDTRLSRKTATRTVPRNRHDGGAHHEALNIKTWKKRGEGLEEVDKHSLTLEGAEIQSLLDFVSITRSLPRSHKIGTWTEEHEVPIHDADRDAIRHLQAMAGPERGMALRILLQQASHDPELLRSVLDHSSLDVNFLAKAASALNLAVYERSVIELEALIKTHALESAYRQLLASNPWMFGTEYARLLDARGLTVWPPGTADRAGSGFLSCRGRDRGAAHRVGRALRFTFCRKSVRHRCTEHPLLRGRPGSHPAARW